MKHSDKINLYKGFIAGVNSFVPIQNGKLIREINFDNAATTPPLKTVLEEVQKFSPYYSSYHRGTGYKSQLSSALYENSKNIVLDFVGGDRKRDVVIYVKNTTEAINKLSKRFRYKNEGSIILSTTMEHHSNDLPWRSGYEVFYVNIDERNRLDLDDLEYKLKKFQGVVKLVTVTGASNVTGYVNPVYTIARLSHRYGAKILVDGAQLIPHCKFDMKPHDDPSHIDFLAFSSHKMYCPFDIGVLIGSYDDFVDGPPDHQGGGTVDIVTHKKITWADPPHKDEAGSPNIIGAFALGTAIKTLNYLSLNFIDMHERKLKAHLLYELKELESVSIYCDFDVENSVGIVPFNIEGIHHETLSKILSYEFGIATRSGCFCAQPYVQRILKISEEDAEKYRKEKKNRPGMVRASFGLYNTDSDVERLVNSLILIIKNKNYYNDKYKNSNFSYF
ncbi:aminotransferase class V-fold PLP-dependent enzyme [Hathewaya histolytica]|uniref:aminotransferase class V-fold PLP-dependent enzyme n=1 Tax=Hathewaya histolytica TaxID=1498 RepID=UPI003B681C8D